MTASAASAEAAVPRAPMATPTSAAASAGASSVPSPTIITGQFLRSESTRLGKAMPSSDSHSLENIVRGVTLFKVGKEP
jgi:hypothetical protein